MTTDKFTGFKWFQIYGKPHWLHYNQVQVYEEFFKAKLLEITQHEALKFFQSSRHMEAQRPESKMIDDQFKSFLFTFAARNLDKLIATDEKCKSHSLERLSVFEKLLFSMSFLIVFI